MSATPKKQRGHTPGKSAAPTTRGNDTALRLEYDGQSVEFTGDGWINGTQVAERFGKRLRNWLRLAETQAYMRALAAAVNSSDVSGLIRRQRGRNGRTLLHPKLAVALARWCDVRFAVWCDLQIDHILRGGLSLWDKAASEHSSTRDREPLLTVAAAIVARHRLSYSAVYEALDHFAGVAHARQMTCAQVTDAAEFGARLLAGSATPADFERVASNRARITAPAPQLSLADMAGGAA